MTFFSPGIHICNQIGISNFSLIFRYIRELDFGRFDLWFRNGLHCFVTRGRYVVQHACTIRYRRPIHFLRPYIIKTRLIWWDACSLYFEQQVVTLHDGFVRAVALAKQTIVNGGTHVLLI